METFSKEWAEKNPVIFPRVVHDHVYSMYEVKILIDCYLKLNGYKDKYRIEMVERETEKGFNVRFHRDHYNIFRNKTGKIWNVIQDPVPFVTAVLYHSTYGRDFTGGEFEFWNGEKIYPKNFMLSIIDSNDVHKVNIQRSGIRKVSIVKVFSIKN